MRNSFRRKPRPAPLQLSSPSPISHERREEDDSISSDLSPQTERSLSSPRSSSEAPSEPYSTSQLSPSKTTISTTTSKTSSHKAQTTTKPLFTRTTFAIFTETQTQSLRSPREKDEQSPDPTQTVFITEPPQLITVTLASKASTISTSNSTGGEPVRSVGGSSFSPVAMRFLIALSTIGGVALIVGVAVIFRQRKRRNMALANKGKRRLSS